MNKTQGEKNKITVYFSKIKEKISSSNRKIKKRISTIKNKVSENNRKIKRCVIYFGLLFLTLVTILSVIGMIVFISSRDKDWFATASSIFISCTGSILTILALMLTLNVAENDYKLKTEERRLELQTTFNIVRSSLAIDGIDVYYRHNNYEITHKNAVENANSEKNYLLNFVMKFSAEHTEYITGIKLNSIRMYVKNSKNAIAVNINQGDEDFSHIHTIGKDKFIYEIVTKITRSQFDDLVSQISQYQATTDVQSIRDVQIVARINMDLSYVTGESIEFKHKRQFVFDHEVKRACKYVFPSLVNSGN